MIDSSSDESSIAPALAELAAAGGQQPAPAPREFAGYESSSSGDVPLAALGQQPASESHD